MILQAESKKEYEEVSVEADVFNLLYCFTSSYPKISAATSISHRTKEELSRLICVVFISGFVLGHI